MLGLGGRAWRGITRMLLASEPCDTDDRNGSSQGEAAIPMRLWS
jgi:hypothetical protein